jgi:hypothetical protein
VSLADQLTHGYLCELGDAYPRGAAYFDEGRVQAMVIEADAVEGTVLGSVAYRARIERSEMGGGDPAGSAGGAGGKAPRGIDPTVPVHPVAPRP